MSIKTSTSRYVAVSSILIGILFLQASANIHIGSYTWCCNWGHAAGGNSSYYGGSYAHDDLAWTWTIEQGLVNMDQCFTSMANCLDAHPTYFSGTEGYQEYEYECKKRDPAVFAKLKAYSDAGKFDGTELAWGEGYWSMTGDEGYLRNYYISYRNCYDNFGYAPLVAGSYDLMAPSWTQPKMQAYIVGRTADNPDGISFAHHECRTGVGQNGCNFPQGQAYKWTSDDGSFVIAANAEGQLEGPAVCQCYPSAGRFPEFAKKVIAEKAYDTLTPTWNDNLTWAGSGCSIMFWGFKMCENRLIEAEKFSTFARRFGYVYQACGDSYWYETWGAILRYTMHDIADIQGQPWQNIVSNTTNVNAQDDFQHALKFADTTLTSALSAISSNVNTQGTGTSVIVYNSLSWARTDYVKVTTASVGFSSPISVTDPSGNVVPSQVISDNGTSTLVFIAENVPSLGYAEYKVVNTAAVAPGTGTIAHDLGTSIQIENDSCRVVISKAAGTVTSAYDKVRSKELLSGTGNQIAATGTATDSANWWDDCCTFYSHYPRPMPATLHYITPTAVQLLDSGPVVARVQVTWVDNGVNWNQYIMVYNKVPYSQYRMVTSNLIADNELTVNFPLATTVSNGAKTWNAGVAFGHQNYVNKTMYTTTHKWANVASDAKDYSVSLLENNCTNWSFYGTGGAHDFRLVLIAEKPSRYSGHWSKTDWDMSWGLWGHPGDWNSGSPQKGYEFNSPLIARVEKATHAGSLPNSYSFLSVLPGNIVVTAVKKWESEPVVQAGYKTMQVRFYEVNGTNSSAVFTLPGTTAVTAQESMGNEYGVYGTSLAVATGADNRQITFPINHNQIRSLKIQVSDMTGVIDRNHAQGVMVQRLAQEAGGTIRICNLKGQVVYEQDHVGQLDAALSRILKIKGMYFVQYSIKGKGMVTTKILRY
jgi:hypothetical protein